MKPVAVLFSMGLALVLMGGACARYPTVPEREAIQAAPAPRSPAAPASKTDPLPTFPGAPQDYLIGPEDVLTVRIWNHDDLSRDVPVSQNGDFTYPLIGQVKAGGRTVGDVEKEMTRRLAEGYLVKPQVVVTVKEYRSQKIFVVGEVRSPGAQPLTGPTSVVEILAKVGGPTEKAGTEVLVVRPKDQGRRAGPVAPEEARAGEAISLDLRAIQQGEVSHNIRLQNGDTVVVPKAKYFFVSGEVRSPGQFLFEHGITVLKAITIAGGLTDKAAGRRIRIVREKAGVRVEIPAGASDLLEPNDIVMVPESFF
jgi:polysaccharide biosynthesis/export protein